MICISACRNGLNRQSGKSWRKEGGKETFKTKIGYLGIIILAVSCDYCNEVKELITTA